jgi:hypothetical protein
MSSQAQVDANRRNPQFSTRSTSESVRAKSSLNTVKTLLTGHTVLQPGDDAGLYEAYVAHAPGPRVSWTRRSEVVTIKDALGLEWDIKEARPTKHGFDLYYGKRKNATAYDVGGPNRLIYTNELKAFWERCSPRHDGTIFDLPAGRTTLKRARVALGFNWDRDSERFWRKHRHDLETLSPREFEKKHKDHEITGSRMSFWRLRIVGGRARPLGWWKRPDVLKLLLSEEKSLNQVRAELQEKISTSQVFRLRQRAKRAYTINNGTLLQIAPEPEHAPRPL